MSESTDIVKTASNFLQRRELEDKLDLMDYGTKEYKELERKIDSEFGNEQIYEQEVEIIEELVSCLISEKEKRVDLMDKYLRLMEKVK